MVTLARRAHRIPFAPVVAVLFGVAAAVLVAAVPQWMFEAGVVASGLPTVIAAAAPPLGMIARLLAIALAFAGTAFVTWMLLVTGEKLLAAKAHARTPWRDGGYDADVDATRSDPLPPRRPIFAPDELGAPLMSDEAIAPVIPCLEPEPALAEPVPAEALAAVVVAPVKADDSITALIRRLEDGLARRGSNDRGPDGPGQSAMPLSRDWIVGDASNEPSVAGADDDGLRQALGSLRRMVRS
jgi:hypothetical protein